jgi:dTDP-4-dehydrorhamnose 3,5-epimerase
LGDDRLEGLYVPEGVAHGFLTLSDDVLISYQISAPYAPQSARGVRWDDAAFAIEWPEPPTLIGARDRSFPDYVGGRAGLL